MSLDPNPVRQDHPEPVETEPEPQEPIRTLLWTAATIRPLDEVAALVGLLKRTGEVPSPADEALRAAAVARPLDEVRQLVALLNEPPGRGEEARGEEADTTLRAAAVGRPIEDVVQLVNILGTDEGRPVEAVAEPVVVREEPPAPVEATPAETPAVPAVDTVESGGEEQPLREATGHRRVVPTRPLNPPFVPPAAARPPARARRREPAAVGSALESLRSVLRWPAAAAFLVMGLIHLPKDLAELRTGGLADAAAAVVTVLCLVLAVWLAVQDTVWLWAVGILTAVGVVVLQSLVAFGSATLPAGSLGGSYAWARTVALACAIVAAALAGSALMRRHVDTAARGARS